MSDSIAMAQDLMTRVRRSGLRQPAVLSFGPDVSRDLARIAAPLAGEGRICAVVARAEFQDILRARLADAPVAAWAVLMVSFEPTSDALDAAADRMRAFRPSLLIACGGGSALDTAKALSALATNPRPVEDYLENVGPQAPLAEAPLPWIGIPTTAGTGAEMTRNAVVEVVSRRVKRSLRDDRLYAAVALVDPEWTVGLPPAVTAAGGLDAITQLIESCITRKRRPEVTELALAALRGAPDALLRACEHPRDLPARVRMSLAASVSGVCLANAGLAMAHGIAAALGARHGMPHGLACGLLLPHTLRASREACAPDLARALAALLDEDTPRADTVERGLAVLTALNARLGVPPDLRHLRLKDGDLDTLALDSMGSSMSGNPLPMTPETVRTFLAALA